MNKVRHSNSTPIPLLMAADFFGMLLSLLPVTANYLLHIFIATTLWSNTTAFVIYALFSPWAASFTLIVFLFCIRMVFPRLKPGKYKVSFNAGFVGWSLQFYLNRALPLAGLRRFVFTNNLLRFLYLRAMGGKFPYQMNGSMGIDFSDLPLLEVGVGSTLAEGVYMSAHSFTGQILILSKVRVGENVFLGMDVTVGPGSDIGSHSWIGCRNSFMNDQIPAYSHLPNFVWEKGNPARLERAEVVLGKQP